jgi:hypothetical protein
MSYLLLMHDTMYIGYRWAMHGWNCEIITFTDVVGWHTVYNWYKANVALSSYRNIYSESTIIGFHLLMLTPIIVPLLILIKLACLIKTKSLHQRFGALPWIMSGQE